MVTCVLRNWKQPRPSRLLIQELLQVENGSHFIRISLALGKHFTAFFSTLEVVRGGTPHSFQLLPIIFKIQVYLIVGYHDMACP